MTDSKKKISDKSITVKIESAVCEKVQKLSDMIEEKLNKVFTEESVRISIEEKLDQISEYTEKINHLCREIGSLVCGAERARYHFPY